MIEDKSLGLKVAKDEKEAMVSNIIEKIKKDNINMRLTLELNEVILDYLKKKNGGE